MIGQYKRLMMTKRTVNIRRINKEAFQRKLRIASFVPVARLVKSKVTA